MEVQTQRVLNSAPPPAVAPPSQPPVALAPQQPAISAVPIKRGRGRPRRYPRQGELARVVPVAPQPALSPFAPDGEPTESCIEVAASAHINQNNQNYQLNQKLASLAPAATLEDSSPRAPKIRLFSSQRPIAPRRPVATARTPLPQGRRVNLNPSALGVGAKPGPGRPRLGTTPLKPKLDTDLTHVSGAKPPNGSLATPPNASPVSLDPRSACGQSQLQDRRSGAANGVLFDDEVLQSHFDRINATIAQADKLIEEAETGFPPETVFMVVHDSFRSISDRRLHMTAFVHLKSANALALELFTKLYLSQGLQRHGDFREVSMADLSVLPPGHLVWAVDYEGDGCLSLVWSESTFCARVYVYRQKVEKTHTPGTVELGGPQSKMELD
ncbi:hypothetical protein GQ53DRAFT_817347 [Thozetella sp. PMI_491]|nr:hypothetical protein GQ53DRAFT_817347 [Thozetella sp. PMI_491]